MTRYIDQLNVFSATPVTGDYALGYQASAGASDKDRKIPLDWFGYLSKAQTWTATQTIAPTSTSDHAISVKMLASTTGDAMENYYNNVYRSGFRARSGVNVCYVYTCDLGAAAAGPLVFVGRNSNATTPAAGCIDLADRAGVDHYYWTDASGNMRIGALQPTSAASDTSGGTVVGTQTSMAEAKNISEALPSLRESFQAIVDAARNGLRSWSYKSGAFNGEFFPNGLVTDLAPRYGMDRDAEHPAGKSLNIPVAIGDLIASISILHERITALEGA